MILVFLVVAALLALALGEEHPANIAGGAQLLNGTFLDTQIPYDQVNFKPMTKWEGGLEKGVAYRIFQAIPGIVSCNCKGFPLRFILIKLFKGQ